MSASLVGIVGRKRAGKDTAARRLVAEGFEVINMKDPMLEFLAALDPLIAPELRWNEAMAVHGYEAMKENFAEVRRLLQCLGTEAGRGVLGENVWVNRAEFRISVSSKPIVVPDVRFLNEADMILRQGGILVRVVRPDLGRDRDTHQSEVEQDQIVADYTIINGGTPEEIGNELWDIAGRSDGRGPHVGLPIN